MLIVNKAHNDVYNLDHITNMYIASSGCSIKAVTGATTRGGTLGEYDSYEKTNIAFEMLISAVQKGGEVFYMPSDEELKQTIRKETYHHATGKKTKGYGGS